MSTILPWELNCSSLKWCLPACLLELLHPSCGVFFRSQIHIIEMGWIYIHTYIYIYIVFCLLCLCCAAAQTQYRDTSVAQGAYCENRSFHCNRKYGFSYSKDFGSWHIYVWGKLYGFNCFNVKYVWYLFIYLL